MGQYYGTSIDSLSSIPQVSTTLNEFQLKNKLDKLDKPGFFSNNTSVIGQVADFAGNLANGINTLVGGKDPHAGPEGDTRAFVDNTWNSTSDMLMNLPGGQIYGAGMKIASALNSIQNVALGSKALDNMTTTDALLSSPLGMAIPGLGLVNALTGKNADTITKNEEVFEQVGSSNGGVSYAVDEALQRSGKRYGGLSSGARKDANSEIAMARNWMFRLEDISTEATTRKNLTESMAAISGNRRAFAMQGGYNQAAVHLGKNGMVIAKRVASQYKIQEKRKMFSLQPTDETMIEEFKEGGTLDNNSIILEVDIDSLPEEFKDGGVLGSSIIKEVEIEEMIEEFKEGGAFNVIPDGALHARLHHMENSDNITKKGIPVVSEKEGGELEQHAEIEKEEIIYRISVTKRLEELLKQYESDDYSQEEKDQFAIEAGKLLVQETLYNTVDNAGLIYEIN